MTEKFQRGIKFIKPTEIKPDFAKTFKEMVRFEHTEDLAIRTMIKVTQKRAFYVFYSVLGCLYFV